MDKIIFIEGKVGTGAERLARELAEVCSVPYYMDDMEQTGPCVVRICNITKVPELRETS